MSRQRRIPTPSWEKEGITGGLSTSRLQMLAAGLVAVLVLAAVSVVGYGFLSDYLQDRNRPNTTAVRVADTEFTVRDFTNRSKIYVTQIGGTSNYQFVIPTVVSQLEEQVILIKYASEKNVSASDDDVKGQIATLLGIEVTDPNFDQRLQEELDKTGLSDEQYRDFARANVLRTKMNEQFETDLPAAINSVHYRQIVVADQETADELKAEVEGGGDFAALAAEHSTDTGTKDKGGDAGWTPEGFLPTALGDVLFSLDVDQVISYASGSNVTVYQVTEKDAAHAIDEDKKPTLAGQLYREWVDDKKAAETIVDDMDFNNGDFDKIRWVIEHAELTA